MNQKDIQKTVYQIKEKVKDNFHERLAGCIAGLESSLDDPATKVLTERLMGLWENHETYFNGLFEHVTCWKGLDTIEGGELFLSFIGNFYDDATFELVEEIPDHIKSMRKSRDEHCRQYGIPCKTDEDNIPFMVIRWSNDLCQNPLNEKKLFEFLDRLQVSIEESRQLAERVKKAREERLSKVGGICDEN